MGDYSGETARLNIGILTDFKKANIFKSVTVLMLVQ